ncbi:DUF6508 domain-containing protein [Pseudomonas alloputida]|uniref:DUF6508 domain-containing protein n=1 Tax=Pseudomonas TaxID=286 RepID=UPI003EF058D7
MHPTQADIEALLSYQSRLYPNGVPIKTYTLKEGSRWPDYEAVVSAFYREAARDCWTDINYRPSANDLLSAPDTIAQATLPQLQSLLTYCVRGERFCDGHWAAMIEKGHVLRILTRLVAFA